MPNVRRSNTNIVEASLQTRWSLINRLKDWNDHQSWQEFFDAYWRLIYTIARRAGLTDAEAQDLVQETILSLAKKIDQFKCDPAAGSFKSWLLTLTRWRIGDQLRKRAKTSAPSGEERPLPGDVQPRHAGDREDTARTSTVDRIVDPASPDLEAMWAAEWEKNLLEAATERVKCQVDPEQYQLFDFHVIKQWPARKVAARLGVSLGKVYFAKYKVSSLVKRECARLASPGRSKAADGL